MIELAHGELVQVQTGRAQVTQEAWREGDELVARTDIRFPVRDALALYGVVTYRDAAALLDRTLRTVRRYVKQGRLGWVYTGRRLGNFHREKGIPLADVAAVLRERREGGFGPERPAS